MEIESESEHGLFVGCELYGFSHRKVRHNFRSSLRTERETEQSLHIIGILYNHRDRGLMDCTIALGHFQNAVIDEFLKKIIRIAGDNSRSRYA